MSVIVILELQSKPDTIDELKAALKSILPDTRAFDGCLSVQVTANQDDPCNLVLIEKWESRQHNETYMAWRTETGAIATLGEMLSQAPSLRYYDDLDI
ncbi:MAG: antibiotic biosynthesis monooxygenase [Alteromonadaceae bacterium]|nr:MAG: antibiotic biosynthesis monooxygenase [Alteromonadaceae bacterium]